MYSLICMTLNVYALSVEVIAVMIRFYKIAATLTVVLLFAIFVANVTRSDKIGLIAEKYTCSYYGIHHLICRCY